MKSIEDYTSATPAAELYAFLAEAIVDERITSFSDLMEYVAPLPQDARLNAVVPRMFRLIRKLQWGFFKDVDQETYPKVWREIVIPDAKFKNCGSLKRNLTISDVYVGIVDLHGYTRFCEKNKNNLSMLQMLDDMIQVDVANLAREHNVVLQRRQGDEMVLVGASAGDVLAVTLLILDYFSKRRSFNVKTETAHRGGYKIILEEMHISAGIAGGKKFTPFIITRDGDLSGGVVNTAARLQGRANELSAARSRVMVTRTVYASFQAEMKTRPDAFFKSAPVAFFDSGWIEFKGISVAVHEVIYAAEDRYKLLYEDKMADLYKALDQGAWKDGIFSALMTLLAQVFRSMPKFKLEPTGQGDPVPLVNEDLARVAVASRNRFQMEQDYVSAIGDLENLMHYAERLPLFDRLCMEYTEKVTAAYRLLCQEYERRMANKIDEKAATVLPTKYKPLYTEGRKGAAVYEKLRAQIQGTLTPLEISLLWSAVVDEGQKNLSAGIHSGKR